MLLVLHKFIDDTQALIPPSVYMKAGNTLDSSYFQVCLLNCCLFVCLDFWFALFLMNERILEENSVRSTSWFWSCFSSQSTVT